MTVVSKAAFARHIGVSRPAVTKMVNAGRIPVRGDGKINLEEAVVAYEGSKQIGREVSADNGKKGGKPPVKERKKPGPKPKPKAAAKIPELPDEDDDQEPITATGLSQQSLANQFNKAKLAKETYTAKLKEMEYKKARGELLEIDEVRTDAKKTAEDVRAKLFAIAPKLAPQVVGKEPREAQRMIEDAINRALTAFHTSKFAKEH